jgi:hypothetical protein
VNRLRALIRPRDRASPPPPRRGPERQHARRCLEQDLRGHVVEFCHWTAVRHWSLASTAGLLHLAPRTLRQWRHEADGPAAAVRALGRPVRRTPVAAR